VPSGIFTGHVFNGLQHGDLLRAEIPFGDFTLRNTDKPIVFVAGSTGFAPIQSIIEDMLAKGIRRPATLYWGARDANGLYSELPARWAREHSHFKYVPVVSEAPVEGIRYNLVHRAVIEDHRTLAGYEAYVCGAPAMTQVARTEFLAAGLSEEDFNVDAFVTRADSAGMTDPLPH
jgi:CDP-4-dehydro-6-deoxyglucose reductase